MCTVYTTNIVTKNTYNSPTIWDLGFDHEGLAPKIGKFHRDKNSFSTNAPYFQNKKQWGIISDLNHCKHISSYSYGPKNSYTCNYITPITSWLYTPNAPCMEYLPTFARTKSPSHVGKYTSTMVRIWVLYIIYYKPVITGARGLDSSSVERRLWTGFSPSPGESKLVDETCQICEAWCWFFFTYHGLGDFGRSGIHVGIHIPYPLVNIQKANLKMAIEIVSFPIKHGGFP